MKSIKVGMTVAALCVVTSAFAAVSVDENGVGFVGKGDVQSVFDWNNKMLQDNAHLVQFQISGGGTATWICAGVNASGQYKEEPATSESNTVNSSISYDARRNSQGHVTGFLLTGTDTTAQTSYTSIGDCGKSVGWQVPKTLKEGSLQYEGSGEPTLKVSINGTEWHALSITY